MHEKVTVLLYDINNSIVEIESYFNRIPKQFARFESDSLLRRAIERNIEIIGEAVSQLIKVEPCIAISDTRKIINARNRIIHGYRSVDNETVWNIVIKHLPVLKVEICALLDGYYQDPGQADNS